MENPTMKQTKRARKKRWRAGMLAACILLSGLLSGCVSKTELTELAAQLGSAAAGAEQESDASLSRTEIKELLASTAESTADHAVAAGENAMLEGYIPVAGKSMSLRIRVDAYLNAADFSQYMFRTLQYDQMAATPCSAVSMELEVYGYSNPQLPYLEDMMEIELLSSDGEVIGALRNGLYTYNDFAPLMAVQNQVVVPGWLIVETGAKEPACLRVVTHDRAGLAQTAYLALPASDGNAAPDPGFTPSQAVVGDTLTAGSATVRVAQAKVVDKVFTAAVGNEYYSLENGTQLLDLLLEYEGPVMNAATGVLGAMMQGGVATPCDVVLLEMPDRQSFSRTFETAEGTNLLHIVFLAPEAETPAQILFSVGGAAYVLDDAAGGDAGEARPIAQKETDTVEGGFEIVIDRIAYSRDVRSTVSNDKYMLHEAGTGNMLLVVTYQLKNLSQDDLVLSRDAGIYVTYDEDAEAGLESVFYTGQVTRRAAPGKLDPTLAIAPGEESKVNFAFVEVPQECQKRAGTIWLSICGVLYSIPTPVK